MNDNISRQMGLPGAVLDGRFLVEKFIGSGGMGAVYRGTQLNVQRPVAIKLLHTEDVSGLQQQRFEREARIMATFTHPNIVQFHDLGRTPDGLIYIVMEYVDGVALSTLLKTGRLSVDAAVEIAIQLFGALSEAHAHGIIHRDIKPENMLIAASTQGLLRLKVLDFGLAHGAEDARLTQAGRVSGTPFYLSPEMARDEAITSRSDLYSAGVVLFEMLTGNTPFSGASMQVMFKHVNDEPPTLDGLGLPTELVKLVTRLLAKKPADRPANADEVLAELEPFRPARGLLLNELDREILPAWISGSSRPLAMPNTDRTGTVPATPTPAAPPEPRGAWDAFRAVADAGPEPEPILDPNLEGSFEFEGSLGASDVFLKPVPQLAPQAARSGAADTSTEVDQFTQIKIPAGARVMSTDQLQAVQGPTGSEDAIAPVQAPVSVKQAKMADLKPTRKEPAPGHLAARTAQVHDGTAYDTRHRAQKISPVVWLVLLMVFGAVGYGLFLKFQGIDPKDTRTPVEREADWLRLQKEAEARQNGGSAVPETEAPAVVEEPAPKTPKRRKKSVKPDADEVIELFDDQEKMAPKKVTIERRQ